MFQRSWVSSAAVLALHPLEEDLDSIAGLDFPVLAGGGEFPQRHAALRFEPNIHDREVVLYRDHESLENRPLKPIMGAE